MSVYLLHRVYNTLCQGDGSQEGRAWLKRVPGLGGGGFGGGGGGHRLLDEWKQAKRARDYVTSDRLRDQMKAEGFNPETEQPIPPQGGFDPSRDRELVFSVLPGFTQLNAPLSNSPEVKPLKIEAKFHKKPYFLLNVKIIDFFSCKKVRIFFELRFASISKTFGGI